MKKKKRTVKQNAWGNWRGYEGGKFVQEFPSDVVGPLIGTTTICGAPGTCEMPEQAAVWIKGK